MALLFVTLSCADLALTTHLLRLGNGEVYEANWLAAAVLARYGLSGLAVFKGLIILLTGALVGVLALSRPERARRLAGFACLAVGAVVLYSLTLWGQLAAQRTFAFLDQGAVEREARRLNQAQSVRDEFVAVWAKWAGALAEGRCSVREAVAGLRDCRFGQDPTCLAGHRDQMLVNSHEDCLAGLVVSEALRLLRADGSSAARAWAEQLLAVCRADYGPEVYKYLTLYFPNNPNRRPCEQPSGMRLAASRPRLARLRSGRRPSRGSRAPRRSVFKTFFTN
jgi:hypothetical protein